MGKTRSLCFITCLLCIQGLVAQVIVEQAATGGAADGELRIFGMNGASRRISYDKIKGSPFFNPEWLKAELYRPDGKPLGIYPVKLNLATHEVHFLDKKGYELAADDGVVSRVLFVDSLGDGKPRVSFRDDYDGVNLTYNGNRKYAQELNTGDMALLKVTIRDGREADSMFGTLKRYYFTDRYDYYVRVYKRVEKLKKLNQDEIFAVIPAKREVVDYVKQRKLNLKKEEDVIALFDYLNSQPKAAPNNN